MEEALEGRSGGLPANGDLEHVDHQDAELESVRMTPLVRVGGNAARAPHVVGHEVQQGRARRRSDGRADVVRDARGRKSSWQDAHRARMLGGGECTRQGSATTDVTEDGAFEDVGQHGKRAGSVREPRRLGDKHVIMISTQGGHQGDGDAGEGIVDHKRG